MSDNLRIFIGLTDIAGYYQCIAKPLHEKGYKITFYNDNISAYNPDIFNNTSHLWFVKVLRKIQSKINKTKSSVLLMFLYFLKEFFNVILFLWCLGKNDVFLFSYGRSFLASGWDLWLLKRLGKRIIVNTGHGSDARPPYIDGSRFSSEGVPPPLKELFLKTHKRYKAVKRIEKYADEIICAPYIAHFLERDFVNWIVLGIPVIRTGDKTHSVFVNKPPKVLHAPSHLFAKGTNLIRAAINELRKEGLDFEYVELTSMPHNRVIEEIQKCDFIVDQVFSDIPMAGFTAESAFFGKPAVIAGYGLEELKHMLPQGTFPPVHICKPDELKNAIREMLLNKEYRRKTGEEAMTFIRNQWSPDAVAERFLKIIEGDVPDTWIIKPEQISYCYGATIKAETARIQIRNFIAEYGITALKLSHRPDLEKAFVAFANSTDDD